MTELDDDGYRRLAAAVVVKAYRDAVSGDQEAADWLKHTGLEWAGAVIDQLPEDLRQRLYSALETSRKISRDETRR
mgnify:CR=1 FL=1